jgi:CheY-like chemotaxis protein
MPTQNKNRKRILFVDDDPHFLEIVKLSAEAACSNWEVFIAESAAKALAILQQQDIDFAVLDIKMPEIDGLQLLKLLHRRFPGLTKAMMTSLNSKESRAECLSNGAELVFEKPLSGGGLKSIFSTINQLLSLQPEEGFRGVLRKVGLEEVIQLECLSKHSLIMEIKTGTQQGVLYIKDGSIVHVQAGDLKGEQAFYKIFMHTRGEFTLKPYKEPPENTVDMQWEFLLMEAARVRDEASETEGAPKEVSLDDAAKEKPFVTQPEQAPNIVSADNISTDASQHKGLSSKSDAWNKPAPLIEEFLVCSSKGVVLHEHRCSDTNVRVTLLEMVSQKAIMLAQGMSAGKFDRLEMLFSNGKCIAQVQDDYGVWVKAKYPETAVTV